MRIHITPGFSAARADHATAYAVWGMIADDPNIADGSPEDKAAGQMESDALDRLLSYSATTPAEIAAKLAFMRERDAVCWTGYEAWMLQIERELIELQRPCVSPTMAEAFSTWRQAHLLYIANYGDETTQQHSAAFLNLMKMPCYTPGDFIVKVYVEQLGAHGSTSMGDERDDDRPGAYVFELDDSRLGGSGGAHDDAAQEAFARDIRECDLGRCLLALGRVDFDAEAWFAAARRAQLLPHVLIDTVGAVILWISQPAGPLDDRDAQRGEICQALLGAGLGVIGKERREAVIAHILEHHPELAADIRQTEAVDA